MWRFNYNKYISICNEINKNLEWYHNDNCEEEDNGEKFKPFNGESEGIIWMVKFYYELETIGIIKSNNDEEEIFDYRSNKNICEILDIPFKEKTSIKKTKKTNKIEISDYQVNEEIKSIKKVKRNSYWIFPSWFFISVVFISNEYYWIGWISLIISILYFLGVIGSSTKFDEVKKVLIKKEQDRLNEIKRKEREKELEKKRKRERTT